MDSPLFSLLQNRLAANSRAGGGIRSPVADCHWPSGSDAITSSSEERPRSAEEQSEGGLRDQPRTKGPAAYEHTSARCSDRARRQQRCGEALAWQANGQPPSIRDLLAAHRAKQQWQEEQGDKSMGRQLRVHHSPVHSPPPPVRPRPAERTRRKTTRRPYCDLPPPRHYPRNTRRPSSGSAVPSTPKTVHHSGVDSVKKHSQQLHRWQACTTGLTHGAQSRTRLLSPPMEHGDHGDRLLIDAETEEPTVLATRRSDDVVHDYPTPPSSTMHPGHSCYPSSPQSPPREFPYDMDATGCSGVVDLAMLWQSCGDEESHDDPPAHMACTAGRDDDIGDDWRFAPARKPWQCLEPEP